MLAARLHAKRTFRTDEKVLLTITLTNSSAVAVRVLEWFTPLEGLRSECLQVWHDKEAVEYTGPRIKRGSPTAKNYRLIAPGQSIDASFDLAQAYALPAGSFRVKLATTVYIASGDVPEPDLPALWEEQKLSTQKLTSASVSFRRPADAPLLGRVPPPRHAALAAARLVRPLTDFEAGVPLDTGPAVAFIPPDTNALPAAKASSVFNDHTNAISLTQNALAAVGDNANYHQWFGAYESARAQRVWQVYRSILEELSRVQIVYHSFDGQEGGGPCRSGDIAVAYPGDPNISLCGSFWNENPTGIDSQAGSLVHEFSHVAAATGDVTYGVRNCQLLADQRPDLAINNADSFQYFAEWLAALA